MLDKCIELSYANDPIDINLAIKGEVFENGLSIPSVVKYLSATQSIFDKTYLYHAQKKVISSKERSLFYLKSTDIKQGSLLTTLGLTFTASQQILPFIGLLNPEGVWEYTKTVFDFLKLIFEKKKEGFEINIENVSDTAHVNLCKEGQTISYIFNAPVISIAGAALPHYETITSGIDSGKIESFKLQDKGLQGIHINKDNSKLFDLPTKLSKNPIKLKVEIFEFDKYTNSGKVAVFKGQILESGAMKFKVIGDQAPLDYIEAMMQNLVEIDCLEEKVDHPLYGEKTVALQIIGVDKLN